MKGRVNVMMALAVAGILLVSLLPGVGLFMNTDAGTWTQTLYEDFYKGETIFTETTPKSGSVKLMKELDLPWTSTGYNQDNANFGRCVADAGDVNNDGYDDVIIGADNDILDILGSEARAGAGDRRETRPGGAYLYLGTHWGLQDWPAWKRAGDGQDGQSFGFSVAGAGDVNGDGYDDVIVGSFAYDTSNSDAGKAYIYLGSSGGLLSLPAWTSSGDDQATAQYGYSVSGAGDVNGDGYDDWLVGANSHDTANANAGKVYLYLGSSSISGTSASWTSSGDDSQGALFSMVSGAGDVNGDGYDDWLVGAYLQDVGVSNQAGKVYLYLGSSSISGTTAYWTSSGYIQSYSRFGESLSGAGDVNGDGYDDLVVGAKRYITPNLWAGKAYLYTGSSSGPGTEPAWTSSGDDQTNAQFGASVSGAGDVNGDGYDDWVVGADQFLATHSKAGKIYLYSGSAYGLNSTAAWTSVADDQTNSYLGSSVSGAGDVNGDGFFDVIAGARLYNAPSKTSTGKAYLFMNHESVAYSTPIWEKALIGDASSGDDPAEYGTSVACAGDVNADGYDDWLVGAPYRGDTDKGKAYLYLGCESGISTVPAWSKIGIFDHDKFGWSVAGGGDINGDGYDDWLVGAPGWGSTDYGRIYVFFGSADVSNEIIGWGCVGETKAWAEYGDSLAVLGDINGDGYDDFIVGAQKYDVSASKTEAGKVYVYLGKPELSGSIPAWEKEGTQKEAHFGSSVAGAGDVNGDGLNDVIIGAFGQDSSEDHVGMAQIFLGSTDVGNMISTWKSYGDDSSYSSFGYSVSGIGDVNGDGFDDWAVGAPTYDSAHLSGKVYVFLGSSGLLSNDPAWSFKGEIPKSQLGLSVSGAGDVNGDGYNDWLVGAGEYITAHEGAGKAFLFAGSANVEGTKPCWDSSGDDRSYSYFGRSTAGGGDFNGDGLDDWLIGAPHFDSSNGKVYMYRGRGFCQYGEFVSDVLDAEKEIPSLWHALGWNLIDQPEGTVLKFQVATNDDGNTWNFVGPDGTSGTYYTNPLSQDIRTDHRGRYLRYKGVFTSDKRSLTPVLEEMKVHYGERMTKVEVVSPNGDENFNKGLYYPITWTASGILAEDPITLYYSIDNGDSWTLIATDEENDGIYNWTLPGVNTNDAVVRVDVTDIYGYTATDTSDLSFTISALSSGGGIISLSPTTTWSAGNHAVSWDTKSLNLKMKQVSIYMTTDGVNWNEVARGLENTGNYDLEISPDMPSTREARLKLVLDDGSGDQTEFLSPKFTIDTSPPEIEHTPPESIEPGTTQTITASVHDNFAECEPVLFYRTAEAGAYQQLVMKNDDGQYFISIELGDGDNKLCYYIQVTDGANLVKTEPCTISASGRTSTSNNDIEGSIYDNGGILVSLAIAMIIAVILIVVTYNAIHRNDQHHGRTNDRNEGPKGKRQERIHPAIERRNRILERQRMRRTWKANSGRGRQLIMVR